MLTPTGAVKVMDFGIARAVADSAATMTQTQAVIGTAQYLSPEQARGETVDARSDLYSTGCLLFELLTGRPPFIGDSPCPSRTSTSARPRRCRARSRPTCPTRSTASRSRPWPRSATRATRGRRVPFRPRGRAARRRRHGSGRRRCGGRGVAASRHEARCSWPRRPHDADHPPGRRRGQTTGLASRHCPRTTRGARSSLAGLGARRHRACSPSRASRPAHRQREQGDARDGRRANARRAGGRAASLRGGPRPRLGHARRGDLRHGPAGASSARTRRRASRSTSSTSRHHLDRAGHGRGAGRRRARPSRRPHRLDRRRAQVDPTREHDDNPAFPQGQVTKTDPRPRASRRRGHRDHALRLHGQRRRAGRHGQATPRQQTLDTLNARS